MKVEISEEKMIMTRIYSRMKSFVADDAGATAIEYALIAGIISIAIVASLTNVKTELSTTFTKVGTELKNNASN